MKVKKNWLRMIDSNVNNQGKISYRKISISSKIHLLIKLFYDIWVNLCTLFLVPCSECLALYVNQCNFIMPKSLGHPKTWNITTLSMLVYLLCRNKQALPNIKTFSCTGWSVSGYYLGGIVVNINALFAE